MDKIINVLSNLNTNNYNIQNNTYTYNGNNVPRVTEILSSMLHEEYLINWANYIGRFKHQNHNNIKNESAKIGSIVHKAIEDFISKKEELDIDSIDIKYRTEVKNAFYSFIEWWNIISKNDIEIIMQENTLICPYFGGTLDLLLKINNKIFLFDFKTSNHPSYKYYLQLSAYKWMLNNYYNINVDGCCILMLNKKNISFNEMILDFSLIDHLNFINQCQECFLSLVYSYYMRSSIENSYKTILKGGNKNG